MSVETKTITVVNCDHCNKEFQVEQGQRNDTHDSLAFYTVAGNVYIGLEGGLIGNNFNDDGRIKRDMHFCRPCLAKILYIPMQDNTAKMERTDR